MNYKIYTFCLLILFMTSCMEEKTYVPNGLTKLSENELIQRAKDKKIVDIEKVTYKNEKGEILTLDSIRNLSNRKEWTTDSYVDKNGIIKEMIIRKETKKDREFVAKLQQAYNSKPPIKIVDIDCEMKAEILEEIYSLDQDMRKSDYQKDYNPEIDRQNLIRVVSLIETCGMPTTKEVSPKQMSAIWLVFQHADNDNRKKYFPLLKKASENGDLKKSQIALMQDRILMVDGKPQIYGSQITKNQETKRWEIYDLENPEFVDKRRAQVGLGPLKEYVKNWDIEFNIEQKN